MNSKPTWRENIVGGVSLEYLRLTVKRHRFQSVLNPSRQMRFNLSKRFAGLHASAFEPLRFPMSGQKRYPHTA
jgi:hypothetical protein